MGFSISIQTPTSIHQSRLAEIEQTEKILKDLKEGRKAYTLYLTNLVELLGETVSDQWKKGFIQNSELADLVVAHPTMSPHDKIMFLDFLVKDSDHANGITAYESILKNQKRKMKEFGKKEQLKSALKDYLGE